MPYYFNFELNVMDDYFSVSDEQPIGSVSNLRVMESLGSTVRIGWTGVAGATQYRIVILNTEGALKFNFCFFLLFIG